MNTLTLLGLFSLGGGTLESAPAAWGDFNGDGKPDLFVASPQGDRLLQNRGDGGFDPVTLPGSRNQCWKFCVPVRPEA